MKQIGLANLAVTICFGIGSALLAFWLDIAKDMQMAASPLPLSTVMLFDVVQPLCLWIGFIFWLAAGALWFWRFDMLRLIKSESS